MQLPTKIETLPIEQLIPYARNSRTHSDEQVAQIAASMREFGFTNPVLIDESDGIIAGHGRVMAARKLGLTEVPCIRLAHLTEIQKRAYVIADNKLALNAGWDEEMLILEIQELKESETDLSMIGFSEEELAELFPKAQPDESVDAEPQIDKAEELLAKWGVEPGQLWELGDHRLLCGDSTKKEDVERVMGGDRAESCVTDPPYGIGVDVAMHKQSGTQYGKEAAAKRSYAATDWDKLPPQSVIEHAASFKSSIIFGGNYFNLPPSRCWLVWDKQNGDNDFADCELAWTNLDQPVRIKRHMWNGMIRKDKEDRGPHPTQKPVDVISWCVAMTEGTVFEPFSGSGTTIIACEQLGRKCRAIEISPAYVAVALQRWADATGKTPVLIETNG